MSKKFVIFVSVKNVFIVKQSLEQETYEKNILKYSIKSHEAVRYINRDKKMHIYRDEKLLIHNIHGAAIHYLLINTKQYWIHGQRFTDEKEWSIVARSLRIDGILDFLD